MPAAAWLVIVLCPAASADGGVEVRVTVLTVLATANDQKVEPKLKDIAAEARKHDPTLTGFRLERVTSKPVTIGRKEVFELVEGATAEVTVLSREAKTGRYRLMINAPGLKDCSYSCCCGKFLPWFANDVKTQDKSRVILAVMVKPCPAAPGNPKP